MPFLKTEHAVDTQLFGAVFHDEAIGIEHDDGSSSIDHEQSQDEGKDHGIAPTKLVNVGIKGQRVKEIGDGHCENDRDRKGIIELAVLDQIGAIYSTSLAMTVKVSEISWNI